MGPSRDRKGPAPGPQGPAPGASAPIEGAEAPGPSQSGAFWGPRGLLGATGAFGGRRGLKVISISFYSLISSDSKSDNIETFIFYFLISSDSKLGNIEIFIYFLGKKFLGKHINFYL